MTAPQAPSPQFSVSLLAWCASVLGSFEMAAEHTHTHVVRRTTVQRLQTAGGQYYLKIYGDAAHWNSEVHAYEQWASAFGDFAPHLVAVHGRP